MKIVPDRRLCAQDARPSVSSVSVAMDEEQRQRGTSFGEIARNYDRFRPSPPEEALDWILPPGVRSVAEIGAGTGLLTELLVHRGLDVIAIEPDRRMRVVLLERAPDARIEDAKGEDMPLADSSVDAVLAASSWHWVDQSAGFAEVARVLCPGGILGLMWTGPNRRVPWVRQLMAGGAVATEAEQRKRDADRNRRHRPEVPSDAPFAPPDVEVFVTSRSITLEELVGLAGTYENTDGRTREEFLHDAKVFAQDQLIFDNGTIDLPIGCIAWRATLRD
jgi:SAM-dependent methyltransferase